MKQLELLCKTDFVNLRLVGDGFSPGRSNKFLLNLVIVARMMHSIYDKYWLPGSSLCQGFFVRMPRHYYPRVVDQLRNDYLWFVRYMRMTFRTAFAKACMMCWPYTFGADKLDYT